MTFSGQIVVILERVLAGIAGPQRPGPVVRRSGFDHLCLAGRRFTAEAIMLKSRPSHLAAQKRYQLKNAEVVREKHKAYRDANREHVNSLCRAAGKRYRDRIKAKLHSIKIIHRDPEVVFKTVSEAVSSSLPRFMRDDVISSIMLAILEGELQIADVNKRVREYVSKYNQQHDHYRTVSLDAPMGDTGLRRIDLLHADGEFEPLVRRKTFII